jgi:peptidoglycan/LPS O-acetylase OafA/YrhL
MPYQRAALGGRAGPSLRRFWIHRCRRVLPAYWLQLVILTAACLVVGNTAAIAPRIVFAHAGLIQNLVPWPVPLLNPVYWSMPVEWDFYIVLPLLAWVVARCRWPLALLLAVTFSIAFRVLCYRSLTDPALAAFVSYGDIQQLPARLDQFFIGICAARIAAAGPLPTRRANICLAAGTAAIVALAYVAAPRGDFLVRIDVPYAFFHHSLTAAAFGLLVLGAAGPTRAGNALFANRPMTFLGLISYSLYLWHYPLLDGAQSAGWIGAGHAANWLVVLLGAVPAIVFVAWLSYRFVERPFLASAAPAARRAPLPARIGADEPSG